MSSSDRWQLFIQGCRDKTVPLIVPKDCYVSHLFTEVSTKCAQGIEAGNLRLLFAGKELQNESSRRLSDYHITNMATLVMVLRLPGGMAHWFRAASSDVDLIPLVGFIEVTSDANEPDMISLDNSTETRRARMPCGHVIGRESMTDYCRSLLRQGKHEFRCPYFDSSSRKPCNARWEYFLVRHVARLTADETKALEVQITENYLRKASGVQKCPGCMTWCCREKPDDNRVRCSMCFQQGLGSRAQFCWACLGQWRTDTRYCGNRECDGNDPRIRTLATCPTKTIGDVSWCPTVRGCQKCGILIEHKEACRHMTCSTCSYEFCFICLQEMPRGYHLNKNIPCQVAGRQATLPGAN